MAEKKYQRQDLRSLMDDRESSTPTDREGSNSPMPGAQGMRTTASGQYKLQTTKGQAEEKSKMDFNWDEEDDWDPRTAPQRVAAQVQPKSSSAPWASKPTSTRDLTEEIKKLKVAPGEHKHSTQAKAGGDALSRFRVQSSPQASHGPTGGARDGAHGPYGSHGLHGPYSGGLHGRLHGDSHLSEDNLRWKSRDSSRIDAPGGLRPLGRLASQSQQKAQPPQQTQSQSQQPLADAKPDPVTTEELGAAQKKAMVEARERALQIKKQQEDQEELERKQRLAERLAALDAKLGKVQEAKAKAQEAKTHARAQAQVQAQAARDAKKKQKQEQKQEQKDHTMESWSVAKKNGGGPVQSMRRGESRGSESRGDGVAEPREPRGPRSEARNEPRTAAHAEAVTVKLPSYKGQTPVDYEDLVKQLGHRAPQPGFKEHKSSQSLEVRVALPPAYSLA